MYGLSRIEQENSEYDAKANGCEEPSGDCLSRRAALKRIGAAVAGLAVGCTPLRIVLRAYPDRFDEEAELVDRVLRAFVTTVIPGAQGDAPDLVRVYYDGFYRFARYRSYFASDLCRRALSRYSVVRFDDLSTDQRTCVIEDGLAADSTTQRLYNGAIFLAQLAFYAGIFDDSKGCRLIDFDGRFRGVPLADQTYPNQEFYLARGLTADGNYG